MRILIVSTVSQVFRGLSRINIFMNSTIAQTLEVMAAVKQQYNSGAVDLEDYRMIIERAMNTVQTQPDNDAALHYLKQLAL